MDENKLPAPYNNESDPKRLLYVLLVVLILCGGNGIGLIAAALIWKFTGAIAGAILTAVIITLLALIAALLLIVNHNKKRKP